MTSMTSSLICVVALSQMTMESGRRIGRSVDLHVPNESLSIDTGRTRRNRICDGTIEGHECKRDVPALGAHEVALLLNTLTTITAAVVMLKATRALLGFVTEDETRRIKALERPSECGARNLLLPPSNPRQHLPRDFPFDERRTDARRAIESSASEGLPKKCPHLVQKKRRIDVVQMMLQKGKVRMSHPTHARRALSRIDERARAYVVIQNLLGRSPGSSP